MQFIEEVGSNRKDLLKKVPLIAFSAFFLVYARKLRFFHDNIISRFCYVRIGPGTKEGRARMHHNSLELTNMLFMLLNLTAIGSGLMISAY